MSSQSRVDRLGLEREDREDRLVDPPQRFVPYPPLECFEAERVLTEGQGPFAAEIAIAQPAEVARLGVVGTVDDPQVLPAAHLDTWLGKAAPGAGEVAERLDHHSLATGGGELLPPRGSGG